MLASPSSHRAADLFDAHNHLQDERLRPDLESVMETCRAAGVRKMVVNGSCEGDWPDVADLARRFPEVLPSFGYHPWYLRERSPGWRHVLEMHLDSVPSAVGEIGLDRWKPDLAYDGQEEAFTQQMTIAAARGLPASIHCLQAWGRLFELLRNGPRPACGFLLHSYGGPQEMILPLARLGAYFSFPGYYLHARKARQREHFKHVPPDRLVIETDAPDQTLPDDRNRHPLRDATDRPVNHPANLRAVYEGLAEFLGESVETLAPRVGENFANLFQNVLSRRF